MSFYYSWECGQGLEIRIKELIDEVKLLRANRWAAFSDQELKNTAGLIYSSSVNLKLSQEAEAELERRQAEGEK